MYIWMVQIYAVKPPILTLKFHQILTVGQRHSQVWGSVECREAPGRPLQWLRNARALLVPRELGQGTLCRCGATLVGCGGTVVELCWNCGGAFFFFCWHCPTLIDGCASACPILVDSSASVIYWWLVVPVCYRGMWTVVLLRYLPSLQTQFICTVCIATCRM